MSKTIVPGIGEVKRITIQYFDGVNSSVAPEMAKMQELSHAENARSSVIGALESRGGTARVGAALTATANQMLSGFRGYTGAGRGVFRIATVAGVTSIYSLSAGDVWTSVAAVGATALPFSVTEAEGNLFMVNGDVANRYVKADGTTVVDETVATGHLYGSPKKARLINYFKDRLYCGDYTNTTGTTRFPYGIWWSSSPLGIVGFVDGDQPAGTVALNVTDTKYARTSDTLEIRRSGTLIETITVTAKTPSTLTVAATANAFKSADEVWVPNTFNGEKVWRWSDNSSGDPGKEYDTLRIGSDQKGGLTGLVNIGDNQVFFTQESYSIWNNVNPMNGDYGIGCLSSRGWVKLLGAVYFLSKKGIFRMSGGAPEMISTPVRRYLWGATKTGLEATVAGVSGESVVFYIGQVTVSNDDDSVSETITHCMLEYDIRQENWFVHSLREGLGSATNCSLADEMDVLLASGTGTNFNIYKIFSGSTDGTVANPIFFRADTPLFFPNSTKERYSHPISVTAHVLKGGPVKVFASLDGEPFAELPSELRKGVSTVWFSDPKGSLQLRCRRMRLSFRSASDRQLRLGWVALDYVETLELNPGPNDPA